MSKSPSFQWYPKDWETDETVLLMTFAERGFYVTCLNYAWLNDGLPEHLEQLHKVLGGGRSETKKLWNSVKKSFFFDGKRWRNEKQERQRQASIEFSTKQKLSAKSRWLNKTPMPLHMPDSCDGNATADALAMQSQCSPSTSASATPKQQQQRAATAAWFAEVFWKAWPVKENKPAAEKAARKIKPEERDAVVRGVENWTARILAMDHPIHASTWLNNRRWEDEPRPVIHQPHRFFDEPDTSQPEAWPGQHRGQPNPGLIGDDF